MHCTARGDVWFAFAAYSDRLVLQSVVEKVITHKHGRATPVLHIAWLLSKLASLQVIHHRQLVGSALLQPQHLTLPYGTLTFCCNCHHT